MTVAFSTADAYESSLRDLLGVIEDSLLAQPDYASFSAEGQQAMRESQRGRVEEIIDAADRHFEATEQFERENFGPDGDDELRPWPRSDGEPARSPENAALAMAAFMGGNLLAASALLSALYLDAEVEQWNSDDLVAAREALTVTREGSRIVTAAGAELPYLLRASVAYDRDHEVDRVMVVLRDLPRYRGGARTLPTVDDTISELVSGLVEAADSVVTSTVARSVGGMIAGHVWDLVSETALGRVLSTALDGLHGLRQRLMKFLGKAISYARKHLGAKLTDEAESRLADWVRDKVIALFDRAQAGVARRLLNTAELSTECAKALVGLPQDEIDARLGELVQVEKSAEDFDSYGRIGLRLLNKVPLGLLGPYTTPVLTVAVLSLLSYHFWVAADHLDRPTWVPFDVSPGVAAVIL